MKHANMAQCDRKLYFRVVCLALALSLVSGDCIDLDLGMESGDILDNNITASSAVSQAENGRLNNAGSWCADTADNNNPYLQIDLQTLHIICAVSTQGNPQADQWVETYTLQMSTDGTTWTDYEEFGHVKIFMGNNDRNTENKNIIYEGFLTRYLRIVGKAKHNKFCMRTEVFGVRQKPENIAVRKTTAQSSTYPGGQAWKAVDGNPDTEFNNGHCSHTYENNPSWWRVDLGSDNVPVYEVQIVNRFSQYDGIRKRSENYIITLGDNQNPRDNPECVGRYSFIQYIASAVCYKVLRGPLMTGRYLGIRTVGRQFLQLCEVEVYSRENLAYNKPTMQSSTYVDGDGYAGNSSKAVDGKINPSYYGGRTCSHTQDENYAWWRVDLGRVEPVTEVYVVNRGDNFGWRLDSFEIRVGSSSSNRGVANPMCGAGGYSVAEGQGASFFCRTSLYGRYVTIRNTLIKAQNNVALQLCEVEVYSARRACQIQALGLASSYTFPDSKFSASSIRSGHEASKARLNGFGAWTPSTKNNPSDYLQVDLQYEIFICAVATQGNPNADEWTLKYKLLFSLNKTDWLTYQENNRDKIFNGNDKRHNIIKHNLVGINTARFVRFQPTDFHNHKALRVEMYGVLKPGGPSVAPTTFILTPLNSTSVRASWQLPSVNSIYGVILGFKLLYRNKSSAADPLTVITIDNNSTLSREVAGLGKYKEYEFQVLAFSSVGNGPESPVKVVRTNEDKPSEAPTSFTVAASTSVSIVASWQLPPTYARNGIITGFKLFYKKQTPPSSPATTITINDNANLTYTVTGLEKYTEYEFQVLAFTSVGNGPWSSVRAEKTNEDVPSQSPDNFNVTATTSTSITANWQLPPADSRNGIIRGFKLFYKKKGHASSPTILTINSAGILTRSVTGLDIYTEYEFQVLAFTSVGDGPKSTVRDKRTKEDAPGAPYAPKHNIIAPNGSHGPRLNLQWSRPQQENGIIRNYTLFYSHSEDPQRVYTEKFGADTLSYSIDVLGGVTYNFYVRAVTIKPGTNASFPVDIPEYAPSIGPDHVDFSEVNETTYNITWAPLPRDKSYGKVILYEVNLKMTFVGPRSRRSIASNTGVNSTDTFVVLYSLEICTRYQMSVRAYTGAGPGPYGPQMLLETSKPGAPWGLTASNYDQTQVTLTWKEPLVTAREGLKYTVKYSGKKDYNKTFVSSGSRYADKSKTYTVKDLVPGTSYTFQVYGTSDCGNSSLINYNVETKIADPLPPVVQELTDKIVSESSAVIQLWPAEQRNGPISSYQVIVLKVADGVEVLPDDYGQRLKSASETKLNFYIAAEIKNDPVREKSWDFTIGDEKDYEVYVNRKLEKGEVYVVYQRAITRDKNVVFEGKANQVAKISVTKEVGENNKAKGSSVSAAAIAVPVVLILLLVPVLVIVFLFYRRKKRSEKESKDTPLHLDNIDSTTSTENLVYSNAVELNTSAKKDNKIYQNVEKVSTEKPDREIYQNAKVGATPEPAIYQNVGGRNKGNGAVKATPTRKKELVYSEADNGKPKAVPTSEFAAYFKSKSSNGAPVLREEFKNLPGGMTSPWEVAKNNKIKNRYGNIVSYDHSRVVLEQINGDPKSDYINASYIPTYDEESMCYIATQGPNPATVSDFWRMIWQEKCTTIVMLTNLVEQGKVKCEQYWPESTSRFGAINVTLLKTETFADYVIRTIVLVKDSEKREVVQFHYTTWPDRGVPHHSTALLAFRWKVHVRHQLTGGPLVVHCSAGVGRTGTYIGIDAMLEGAKEQGSVFISNYLQVMRRQRPHMVQKEDQYVFWHKAVMEALVCGNTEISPHDLLIRMNKLARVHKSSKQTGYADEFKRLQLICDTEGSEEGSTAAFKPPNINKNRFPNIVPLDPSRVILRSSEPDKDYINASFVDDYIKRNAYILTQAPLNNTIEDFWNMVSQYDICTVVMLNNSKERKESYPQYWPSKGTVRYGKVTLEMLSETSTSNVTTRKFSVLDAKPPEKKSTVQHLQFTGWTDPNSCPDPQEILELLTAVQNSQQQTGNGVIVFQCSDGVGRSGTVSTIMSAIERVKTEHTVDVFQTTKLIRVKRPGAVANAEQYMFCYKTILAYLDSFNTYSNFSNC